MVTWGESTTDEMYLVGMTYVPYQNGDEDIVIGEDGTTDIIDVSGNFKNKLDPPFPNPTNGEVTLNYYLNKKQNISIELFNVKGQLVKTVLKNNFRQAGEHQIKIDVDHLIAGKYMVRLNGGGVVLSESLVVVK